MSEVEFLKSVSERMSAKFDVKKIILFGSRALDEANPNSDFDISVIVNSDIPFIGR